MLDDNEIILWDSHAICCYLIGKYAKDDSLYPKDLLTRAKINQRLFFDSGVLFPKIRYSSINVFFKNPPGLNKEFFEACVESYDLIEKFLQNDLYLVGDQITVADLACITSITQTTIFVPIDIVTYPKLGAWVNRIAGHFDNFYEINTKIVNKYKIIIDQKLNRNEEEK